MPLDYTTLELLRRMIEGSETDPDEDGLRSVLRNLGIEEYRAEKERLAR